MIVNEHRQALMPHPILYILPIGCFILFVKYQLFGFLVMIGGSLVNTLVMVINGHMPVRCSIWDSLGYLFYADVRGELINSPGRVCQSSDTILSILGDWIYFPLNDMLYSPGDIVMIFGVIVVFYEMFILDKLSRAA